MRPGQPPDRIVRGFLLALSPLGGGMTASARQRSTDQWINECRICQSQLPISDLAITNSQLLRWPAALSRSKE